MSKIAIEQDAYSIGNQGSPVTNKGCIKTRAEELGCIVNGNYSNIQLVQTSDLEVAQQYKELRIQLTLSGYTYISGYISFYLNDGTTEDVYIDDINFDETLNVPLSGSNYLVNFDYLTVAPALEGYLYVNNVNTAEINNSGDVQNGDGKTFDGSITEMVISIEKN